MVLKSVIIIISVQNVIDMHNIIIGCGACVHMCNCKYKVYLIKIQLWYIIVRYMHIQLQGTN